jgi:hypothetical protein
MATPAPFRASTAGPRTFWWWMWGTSSKSLRRFAPGQGYAQFPDGNRYRTALGDLRNPALLHESPEGISVVNPA